VGSSQKLRAATTRESGLGVSRISTPPDAQGTEGEAHQAVDGLGRQVLDDVEGDHAAEAPRRHRGELVEQVPLFGGEPPLAAEGDHLGAGVHPPAGMPWAARSASDSPRPPAEVEHPADVCGAFQIREIDRDSLGDLLLGAAVPPFELEVACSSRLRAIFSTVSAGWEGIVAASCSTRARAAPSPPRRSWTSRR